MTIYINVSPLQVSRALRCLTQAVSFMLYLVVPVGRDENTAPAAPSEHRPRKEFKGFSVSLKGNFICWLDYFSRMCPASPRRGYPFMRFSCCKFLPSHQSLLNGSCSAFLSFASCTESCKGGSSGWPELETQSTINANPAQPREHRRGTK